jgi:hypothetical protein
MPRVGPRVPGYAGDYRTDSHVTDQKTLAVIEKPLIHGSQLEDSLAKLAEAVSG